MAETRLQTDALEKVQAYTLGVEAMREARVDAGTMRGDALMREVAGQLVRAAGSIAANIAEGYSRGTSLLVDPAPRLARLVSIRRLLLTMIRTSRETVAGEKRKWAP